MTKSLLTFLLLFAATTLNAQNSYKPQRGDILFQGAGNSEFSKSIAASTTADTVEFRPIHVAFIIHAADTPEKTFLIDQRYILALWRAHLLTASRDVP